MMFSNALHARMPTNHTLLIGTNHSIPRGRMQWLLDQQSVEGALVPGVVVLPVTSHIETMRH